ncbi:MAG: hypothetical protein C0418_03720 [Coriobacteriaceae bacterium]|nr:hypothetical protein [Coriobacteriaceae bacterium]
MPADRLRTSEVDALLDAFLSLKTPDEAYAFLQDVATVKEIQDLSQRLAVARMLAGGAHYDDIHAATGASATTIARVNRSLNYGADGYRTIIERLGDADAEGGAR